MQNGAVVFKVGTPEFFWFCLLVNPRKYSSTQTMVDAPSPCNLSSPGHKTGSFSFQNILFYVRA